MEKLQSRRAPICLGYGRLSIGRPGLTAAIQEEQIHSYWRRELGPAGVLWGGFFCDAAGEGSLGFTERTQGSKECSMADAGDHVLVLHLDRTYRSAADGATVIQALAGRGVRFHSLDLPSEAGDCLDGGMAELMRAIAEISRSCVSERTLEVIADRRNRGLPVGGQAPVGWRIIGLRARETKSK